MKKRLLNNFVGIYAWVLTGFLLIPGVVVNAQSTADTCQSPAPPVITGSSATACRNQAVMLTATGCAGTVVWSNGDTGSTIVVQPQQTTKYTAICRARPGCISCFAEVWKVTVNTPESPVVTPSATLACAHDSVSLTATGCAGLVRWSDQTTGSVWTGRLTQTTTFQAVCEQNNCVSNPSVAVSVQVALPRKPDVLADKGEICAGQTVQLTAADCVGTVHWSDGGTGAFRTATPHQTTQYRAVCQTGSCQSDSSEALPVTVRTVATQPARLTTLTNGCPFQTADLTHTIPDSNDAEMGHYYAFRMGPSPDAPAVQSPGAVPTGTYYLFSRNVEGCYGPPTTVTVRIQSCPNAVAPCLSNPATVAARLDTLDWTKGVVRLRGQLGGSAEGATWQSDGGGLFTDAGLNARYLLSETDRQRGTATFVLSTPDPDGRGPCAGARAQLTVAAPSREVAGLSKQVGEPVWVGEGATRLVELTYQLTAVNLGQHALTNVRFSDDLATNFAATGVRIHSVSVRADSSLVVNPAYTGRGADTTLIRDGNLAVGGRGHIWLTVRLDVGQANTLTFSNQASLLATDANGNLCRDRSTNGADADPDQNGNPADNDEPTRVTLHSLPPEAGATVFIPEGFSPNGDGVNDRFVIGGLPVGITVHLEIYNRWGHLVYRNPDYQNDWDGTANQGLKAAGGKPDGLPDGTYYYQIRLSDGREFIRFLTLVR